MNKFKNVDDYIGLAPKGVGEKLKQLRKLVLSVVPNAVEKISYSMPYYDYSGRFCYFAYFKDHISLFVMHGVLEDFKDEVADYRTGKATLRFSLDKKLPLTLIKKLLNAAKAKIGVK